MSLPKAVLVWAETAVKNYNRTVLPDLFLKIFYFILPQAVPDFSKSDNLLLFLIVKTSEGGKKRFYVFYSSYTSFPVFHSPPPTAIAHFRYSPMISLTEH